MVAMNAAHTSIIETSSETRTGVIRIYIILTSIAQAVRNMTIYRGKEISFVHYFEIKVLEHAIIYVKHN